MWGDIVLSIATSVGEAICTNQINKKKKQKFDGLLETILADLLVEFADSSLDCNQFHEYVKGDAFKHHLQAFFYTVYSEKVHTEEYKSSLATCISEAVPKTKLAELYSFIDKFETLYENYLLQIIEEDPIISSLFQLIMKANHDAIGKVIENQDYIIGYIKAQDTSNIEIDSRDIKTYHDVCEKDFGTIRFTGISGAENRQHQSINNFYIKNTFSYCPNNFRDDYLMRVEKLPRISLDQIFDVGNKVVILGGAGYGKSTTLNYIYCNYEKIFGPCALKIKIDLKNFTKELCDDNRDMLFCIATDFCKKVVKKNLSVDTVSAMLADLLVKGQCVLIFDALDEITTLSARSKVREAIENFTSVYYLNRYIITSREVGYLRNRLNDAFLHLRINEFGKNEIKEYAQNWYKSNQHSTGFKEFWNRFNAEVKRAKCERLISNPIILVLSLLIFDIENSLPNKRVEFYRKCIDTFLSIREDRKAAFKFTERVRNILGDDLILPKIAYYKFDHVEQDPAYRFTESELKCSVYKAIDVPDQINWRAAVNDFIKYLIERTELICEVDEDILDFAHKTFYEYFLAVFFVKEYECNELTNLLDDWIGDSNFDELARLIIEVVIQNNNSRQHQRLLQYLFERIDKRNKFEEWQNVSVLMILSDLYNHNMLLPKYHVRYFKSLLYAPELVRSAEDRKRHNAQITYKISYDREILAQLFLEAILEPDGIHKVLDALHYLDEEFNDNVINHLVHSKYEMIAKLFRMTKYVKATPDMDEVICYFVERQDGINFTINHPQVFLAVIDLIARTKRLMNMEKFVIAEYEPNDRFMQYTRPETLWYLFEKASKSCSNLIILLISIIDCAIERTNYLISFFGGFRNNGSKGGKKIETVEFICWLWDALNDSVDYEAFKCRLLSRELYQVSFDSILERLFYTYVDREKNIDQTFAESRIEEMRKLIGKVPVGVQ